MFSIFKTKKAVRVSVHNWMMKNRPGRDCALALWNEIARSYESICVGEDVPDEISSEVRSIFRKCGVRL